MQVRIHDNPEKVDTTFLSQYNFMVVLFHENTTFLYIISIDSQEILQV